MNKQRRKDLARALELLSEAQNIIETAQEEEQEYLDNMPESLQSSDRYYAAEAAADALTEALSSLEEAISQIDGAQE